MELSALLLKIQRLYEAVDSATEPDLSKFPPTREVIGNLIAIRQDFSGGLNQAQLQNKAFQTIRSIADLKDHLRATARKRGRDPEEVEKTIDSSLALQLMIDLANFDKHGAHGTLKDQRSKKSPRLINVRGVFQIIATGADIGPGGGSGIRLTPQGVVPFGAGKSAVVITGDIVDASGAPILSFDFAQTSAVGAWESLFATLGIIVNR